MAETPMDLGTALDHARSYVTRVAKPFEKLVEVLEAAAAAEEALKGQRALQETLTAEVARLQPSVPLLTAQVQAARQAAETAAAESRAAIERARGETAEAQAQANAARLEVEQQALGRRKALEAEHAARMADLDRDLKAKEQALAAVTKKLDAIKASL